MRWLLGEVEQGIPKEMTYKGEKVEEEKEMAAWANMFLEQEAD